MTAIARAAAKVASTGTISSRPARSMMIASITTGSEKHGETARPDGEPGCGFFGNAASHHRYFPRWSC